MDDGCVVLTVRTRVTRKCDLALARIPDCRIANLDASIRVCSDEPCCGMWWSYPRVRSHRLEVFRAGSHTDADDRIVVGFDQPHSSYQWAQRSAGGQAGGGGFEEEEQMAKRMIVMLMATAALVGALGFVKFRQIQTAIAQGASFQPPPEAVTTVVARHEEWPSTLSAIGTMAAVQGVDVSADLPGTVERIAFDSGHAVRQGDVLALLDTRQERAQLAAAEAQRDLARLNFDRMQGLLAERVISRAEFDRATAEQRQMDARVNEIRAAIDRKTIRAPFSGILGMRQVNLGQYLAGGDRLVTLQSLNPIYVNFGVPQQAAGLMRVGRTVRLTTEDVADAFTGRVTAIDSLVDEKTRNVQVQATLSNPGGRLRPGMFVQTEIVLGTSATVIALPASAISYAPFGDSVFVVGDLKDPGGRTYRGVRQQFVKLGAARGDQIAVISGLNPGDEVVTSGVFKLRNGAAVVVNNKVRPANSPAPKPENS
jgi:membrane fusion protein (multidrug efflux system)